MNIKAILRGVRISPQKARLVCNLVRNKNVNCALRIFTFNLKKSSFILKKLLKSAISNAKHNYNLDINNLFIKYIYVEKGSISKRFISRAKGRGDYIFKRFCNIYLILNKGQ